MGSQHEMLREHGLTEDEINEGVPEMLIFFGIIFVFVGLAIIAAIFLGGQWAFGLFFMLIGLMFLGAGLHDLRERRLRALLEKENPSTDAA